jgi:hypothetical protein
MFMTDVQQTKDVQQRMCSMGLAAASLPLPAAQKQRPHEY